MSKENKKLKQSYYSNNNLESKLRLHKVFIISLKTSAHSIIAIFLTAFLISILINYKIPSNILRSFLEIFYDKDWVVSPNIVISLSNGAKYSVKATGAYNRIFNGQYILLNLPAIKYNYKNLEIEFSSNKATFYNYSNILYLDDDVVLNYNNQYKALTKEVYVDINNQNVDIKGNLEIVGNGAYLKSAGMTSLGKEETVQFKGPVKIIYNDERQQ